MATAAKPTGTDADSVHVTQTQAPSTFAEGAPIPAPTSAPVALDPPTDEDYAREYGTWRAKTVINVGNARAFNPGDAVPASHPMLNEGEWGKGWIAEEMVEHIPQAQD